MHKTAVFSGTHPNTFSTALEKLLDRTPKSFPLHFPNHPFPWWNWCETILGRV